MSKQRAETKLLDGKDHDNFPSSSKEVEQKGLELSFKDLCDVQLLQHMEDMQQESVLQAQDASRVFHPSSRKIFPEELALFPDSPTARRHLVAFQHYSSGEFVLKEYTKDKFENDADCIKIQPAFHEFARGIILEGHMARQFYVPGHIDQLIDQYLRIRPNDVLAQFFKLTTKVPEDDKTDYELTKEKIRKMEMLAHKILPFKTMVVERNVLKSVYYKLGSYYVTSRQPIRALDSFQKCFDLDTSDYSTIYSLAISYYENGDPEKAFSLYQTFLEMAPKCDSQYPNAYYMLGTLNVMHYNNIPEAVKCYKSGQEAEGKWRLPFMGPVNLPYVKTPLEIIAAKWEKK